MSKEFQQVVWDEELRSDFHAILHLAIHEDLGQSGDWTTRALVREDAVGRAEVAARVPGVVAGLPGVEMAFREVEPRLRWMTDLEDGRWVRAGERIGMVEGPARGILTAERLVLNLLGRLSGIASLTHRYVEAVRGTRARIYDTRKTTPGWRRLEKYAVRCGGGWNHRTGLFDAVLIKDNHLAGGGPASPEAATSGPAARVAPAEAVTCAREYIRRHLPDPARSSMIVEVEVDSLEQLEAVLPVGPDLVLLDNMDPDALPEAVARRDALSPATQLEASGGVSLEKARRIAASGVDRISVGALTHSAVCLDLGLDWLGEGVAES